MFSTISKNLLNISETCRFLGISRRTFAALECSDPSFPKRKTKTKHSRALLESWLAHNGPVWHSQPEIQSHGKRTQRFSYLLNSLN